LLALETVDAAELMMEITKTLAQVSSLFPDATLAIFQDVVDILVAWHIDPSQAGHVVDFIAAALVDLRPYWLKDMPFTLTLLCQFLEDMDSYLGDASNRRREAERVQKVAALLGVFNTVVRSVACVGDTSYQPLRLILSGEHEAQLLQALYRLLAYAARLAPTRLNELIYTPSNKTSCHLE